MSVKTEDEILNALIPEAELEEVTLETYRYSNDNDGNARRDVSVKIRFSLSDIVERDVIGRWFNQANYEKYFGVDIRIYYGIAGAYTAYNQEEMPGDEHSGEERILMQNMKSEEVVELISPEGSVVKKFLFEKTYRIPTTFSSGTKELTRLTLMLRPFFNIEEMEQDLSLDLFNYRQTYGGHEFIDIIRNGNVVYPIQDFRARKAPLEVFSFTDPLRRSLSQVGQRFRETLIKIEEKKTKTSEHLSDLWITRNAQGEASFMFFLDLQTYMEKKSQYRKYVERLSGADKVKLIASLEVPTLKILRKRVLITRSSRGKEVVPFEKDRREIVIAETSKRSNSAGLSFFQRTVNKDIGAIKQVHLTDLANEREIFFLTGTDYSMGDIMNGRYAYGVEFEIVDTTKYFLLKKIENVRKAASVIKKIYSEVVESEHYDIKTKYLKLPVPEILGPNTELASFPLQSSIRKFEELLNIFTEGLLNAPSAFSKPITSFLSTFPSLRDLKSPEMLRALIEVMDMTVSNCLYTIGEPLHGDSGRSLRSGTDLRVKSRKFYESATDIFNASIPKKSGLEYLANFSEVANTDVLRELSTLSRDVGKIGLRVIDGVDMKDRIAMEGRKFFQTNGLSVAFPFSNGIPEEISINACGSEFLSPTYVMDPILEDGGASVPLSIDIPIGPAITNANVASTINPSTMDALESGINMFKPPALDKKEAAVFSLFGAAFHNSEDKKTLLMEGENRDNPDRQIESTENFVTLEEKEEMINQQNFEKYVFTKFAKVASTPDLGTERTLTVQQAPELSDYSDGQSTTNPFLGTDGRQNFQCAPNAVRALAMGPTSEQTSYSSYNDNHWRLSMDFLIALEYVSGFRNEKVRNPIWEPLTYDVYANNAQKILLCRIKSSHQERLGVRRVGTSKPIFDAYFFVSPVSDVTLVDMGDPSQLDYYSEQVDATLELAELGRGLPTREDLIAEKENLRDRLCRVDAQGFYDEIREYDLKTEQSRQAIEDIRNNPDNYDFREGEEYTQWDNFLGRSRSNSRYRDSRTIKPDAQFAIDHHMSIIREWQGGRDPDYATGFVTGRRDYVVRSLDAVHDRIDRLTEEINRYERSLGIPESLYGCPLVIR